MLVLLGAIVDVSAEPTVDSSIGYRVAGYGLLAAMLLGLATLGVRCIRAGVVVSRRGIVVRNPGRSRRFAWDEVDHFSVEPMAWSTVGCVHLRDGDVVRASGICAPRAAFFPNSVEATKPIAGLNAILESVRSDPEPGAR